MRATRYDVIIVGAGAMGSAAGWWLARRGRRVLLLDQYPAGHPWGSSHGTTRMFRLGYPVAEYTSMAVSAQALWRELETCCRARLLSPAGSLDLGSAADLAAIATSYREAGVAFETVAPAAANRRWPGLRTEEEVLYQRDGAVIHADRVLRALHRQVRDLGGTTLLGAGRAAIDTGPAGVTVAAPGVVAAAPVAVVAAGPWTARTVRHLVPLPPLSVTQEQVFYFQPSGQHTWPCFLHRGAPTHYGLPSGPGLVKVAGHHTGAPVSAESRTFDIDPAGRERLLDYVRSWLPGLRPHPVAAGTCLYTSTPTEDFVIDRAGPLVVAAGFSGHGFKFTPLIGRMLADAADGTLAVPPRLRLGGHAGDARGTHL